MGIYAVRECDTKKWRSTRRQCLRNCASESLRQSYSRRNSCTFPGHRSNSYQIWRETAEIRRNTERPSLNLNAIQTDARRSVLHVDLQHLILKLRIVDNRDHVAFVNLRSSNHFVVARIT